MTTREALFELIRISVTGEADGALSMEDIDWRELLTLSVQQGVLGIVWGGIELQVRSGYLAMPIQMKMLWHGVVRKAQSEVDTMRDKAEQFADLISPLPCIVLKGLDYGRFWPMSNYRVFGDLDIWSCGNHDEINTIVAKIGEKVDTGGGAKHDELYYQGLRIENHRYFVSDCITEKEKREDGILREIIGNRYMPIEEGSKLLSPNVNFTYLMMVKHIHNHFLYEGIRLRHVLDCLFFLRRESGNVDWGVVRPALKELGIERLSQLLTQYCDSMVSKTSKDRRLLRFEDLFFEPEMDRRLSLIPSIIRVYNRTLKRWYWRDIL
ncbi:MAG: nucleotidyltransferase family protein [Bacteroidia bacterium]|nr:nucleotidyltransferase family protein [Bacteroidia bacterium]